MTHNNTNRPPDPQFADNPFRDDPFTDDGHLLAPGHPLRKLRGLHVCSVRVFLYRAPAPRPLDRFHPCKHNHRFTPSPYRDAYIDGDPSFHFYVDTRIPADPCPLWAFADAECINLDFFRPTLYLWHAGIAPAGTPESALPEGALSLPPLPPDAAPSDSPECAVLLALLFAALRSFPEGWVEPGGLWDLFAEVTPQQESVV